MALDDLYSWIKFVHVLAVLAFLTAHGASVAVAFRIRTERERNRVRALLDLTRATLAAMYASLALLVGAGVIAGLLGGWFSRGLWIWLSVVLLVGILVAMYYLGTTHFMELRKAVGQPYAIGPRQQPPVEPVADDELIALLGKGRPWVLAAIGLGGFAVIAFLMLFKPF